jgi:hypothetical protein
MLGGPHLAMLHLAVLHLAVLHLAVLHLAVLHLAVLHLAVLPGPVLRCAVLPGPVLRRPVLRCPVLRCPVLRCPVLRCPVLRCARMPGSVLCRAVLHSVMLRAVVGAARGRTVARRVPGSRRSVAGGCVRIRCRPMRRVIAGSPHSSIVAGHRVIATPGCTVIFMPRRIGRGPRRVFAVGSVPAMIVLDRKALLDRFPVGGRASLGDRIPPPAGDDQEKENSCTDDP